MDVKSCVMQDQYNRIQGAKLKVQNKKFSIYKGVNIIGRNKSAAVDLKNLNVSQYHAMIIIVDDSQHFISDLNSSNGTYLFGNKIIPFKLYELPNDTEIKFGDVTGLYFKMSNMNATVHLETESMEQTQNLSQTFYATKTQLMLDDSALNQTVPNKLPQQNLSTMETQDIHEAVTQAIEYPPTINSSDIVGKNLSITEKIISDTQNDSTQVVAMPHQQPSTSKAGEENLTELHETATQIVTFSERNPDPNQPEENIHEMATQVIIIPEKNNFNDQKQEKSRITLGSTVTSTVDEKKTNISVIQDSVIEESVIEESVVEEIPNEVRQEFMQVNTNEDSNDSIDFLTINKPPDIETHTQANIHHSQSSDKESTLSDTQDVVKPRKRTVRRLSSSEDLMEIQKNKEICNSDSETDIEEVDIEKLKSKPSRKLSSSQSDTETKTNNVNSQNSEDIIRKQAKQVKVIHSDSETDIEDDRDHNIPGTQSDDVIKPKVLSRKLNFNSDSETDIEDNKENEPAIEVAQNNDSTSTEILNDTDCIPATQDAFANMFQYKPSKSANSVLNSGNVSSEESFKLGLTELMIDENDAILDQNDKKSGENSPVFNKNAIEITESISEINKANNNQVKRKHSITLPQEINDEEYNADITDTVANKEETTTVKLNTDVCKEKEQEKDVYIMATQKINTNDLSTKQKEDISSWHVQGSEVDNVLTTSNAISKQKETDDLYIKPTQKMTVTQLCNKPEDILSMATQPNHQIKESKDDLDINTNQGQISDEDLYMMPTQKMNDKRQELNTKEKGIYSLATQDLNQVKNAPSTSKPRTFDKDADEDFYMMPTQVIDNAVQSTKQISNDSEERTPSVTRKIIVDREKGEDEDPYMMLTQKINEDDANFKAPQKFTFKKKATNLNESLRTILGDESQDDPYSVDTQKICEMTGSKCNKTDVNKKQKPNVTEEKYTFVGSSAEDPYMQTTQELKPASRGNTDGLEDDPYLVATQQINPESVTTSNVSENEGKGKIFVMETQTELYMSANQNITVQTAPSNQNSTSAQNCNDLYDIPTQPLLHVPKDNVHHPVGSTINEIVHEFPQSNKLSKVGKEQDAISSSLKRFGDTCADVPKTKRVKKSDIENLKKTIESNTTEDAETLSQIAAFVNKPLHESKKDDCVETLSQIEAFIKKPLTSTKTTSEYGKTIFVKNLKEIKDDLLQESETLSQIEAFINKSVASTKTTSEYGETTFVKNLKENKDEILQDSETLSQIEAFIKKPLDKVIPKANKMEEASSVSRKEEDKEETCIKKPLVSKSKQLSNIKNDSSSTKDKAKLCGKTSKNEKDNKDIDSKLEVVPSKQLTRKTKTRQSTRITEEDKQDTSNNLKPTEYKKHRILSEVSDDEKLDTNSETNSSKLNSEQDTLKSDIDQSFALLEAKSTKTRKSQRITNAGEVKVAVRKNRRSMTTSSVAELPENEPMRKKPSTRKSRRVLNNNIEPLSSDTKQGDSSQQKSDKDNQIKHKSEFSDSDFSEPEVPAKMMKISAAKKGKTSAKVPPKITSTTSTSNTKNTSNKENSETKELSIPSTSRSRANTRMKTANTEDSKSSDGEKSSANNPPPSTPSRRGNGRKAISNVENNPTPSASKVRVSSRMKNQSDNSTESSSCDGESISSNDPILATPSRRGRSTACHDAALTMSERSKRKLRPKVVFTMLDSPQMESLIRQLGGSIVDTVDSSTVLVTEHVKRSQKLLTAVGQGKPICSPNWIYASKKANEFLDPWDYILTDKEAETKWGFSLKEAITKAAAEKLLTNYTFQLMVSNAADVLKGAIEACGGKCVKTSPKNVEGFFVVVASPENKNRYLKVKKQNTAATVVEPEAIFDGVLRQELRLGRHLLT